MGWISHLLSGAVLGGFVFAFGIGLIVDQTPKILGVPKAQGSCFQVLIGVIKALPETSIATLIVGASSILPGAIQVSDRLFLFQAFRGDVDGFGSDQDRPSGGAGSV
jgi:MFS superfamily sulfate permease-like transporter